MMSPKALASDEEFSELFGEKPALPVPSRTRRWPLWWSLGALVWATAYALIASAILVIAFLSHDRSADLARLLLFPMGGMWQLIDAAGSLLSYVGGVGFGTPVPAATAVAILSFIVALPFGALQGAVLAAGPAWLMARRRS